MSKLRPLTHEDGQTMTEYGVVLSVMCALVFAALMILSGSLVTALNQVGTILSP